MKGENMKFLKLENSSGRMIRINFNHIESYGKTLSGDYTYIAPCGCESDDDIYLVKQSPEEIDEMLGESF